MDGVSSSERTSRELYTPSDATISREQGPLQNGTKDLASLERETSDREQDPFGNEDNAAMKYKTMTWWQAGMVMIAETISLGILSLPKALATLGLLPGVLVIISIGVLTTYTGYIIGEVKCQHVHVHTMADVGAMLWGKAGREIIGVAQLLFFVFSMASHIITFSIMMNVLTDHSACTIVFSFFGLLLSFVLTLPRRLQDLSYLSWVSFFSILGAVFTTMIGVSSTNMIPGHIPLFPASPPGHEVILAITNVVFAYAGHVAFFTFFSELKELNDYPKSLAFLQLTETIFYTISSVVIYVFVGPSIVSPALNSAGIIYRKIAYGIAIPTIVIGGVVNAHVAVKFIYIKLCKGTQAMHANTVSARALWASICGVIWLLSWLIAESIPIFNDILGLASSLFASWFSFAIPATLWLYLNRGRLFKDWTQTAHFSVTAIVLAVAFFVCVFGLYSSTKSIHLHLKAGIGGGAFSCANNS